MHVRKQRNEVLTGSFPWPEKIGVESCPTNSPAPTFRRIQTTSLNGLIVLKMKKQEGN